MKDDLYWLHQTPPELCKDIISNIPFESTDILLEPFAGEGFFFDNFPEELPKYRTEIEDGFEDAGDVTKPLLVAAYQYAREVFPNASVLKLGMVF